MIKVFYWNCRGASHTNFSTSFKSYRSNFKPNIVILVESRVSGIIADKVCRTLGFEEIRRIKTIGFSCLGVMVSL
ncbi:hypothetical protein LINPERPRIM_LOCUS6319 [Linum perenne]